MKAYKMTQTKICSKCDIEKPLNEYRKDRSKPFGVYSSCKNCSSPVLTKNQIYIQKLKESIEFLPVKGFEGIYSISKCGKILSDKEYIIKSHHLNQSGYPSVVFWVNKKASHHSIHRLIALSYIPNPDNKPQINHIDGNKLNYNISNLEWCTASENTQHACDTGLLVSNRKRKVINERGEIFESVSEASKSVGKQCLAVSCAIRQKSRCGGLYWEYL